MEIKRINRPWNPNEGRYGNRLKRDPFYHSSSWKATKEAFKQQQSILSNGKQISNALCYECMDKRNKATPMHTVDHILAIEDGGDRHDFNNLRSLCLSCHNSKSAKEGNERHKNKSK